MLTCVQHAYRVYVILRAGELSKEICCCIYCGKCSCMVEKYRRIFIQMNIHKVYAITQYLEIVYIFKDCDYLEVLNLNITYNCMWSSVIHAPSQHCPNFFAGWNCMPVFVPESSKGTRFNWSYEFVVNTVHKLVQDSLLIVMQECAIPLRVTLTCVMIPDNTTNRQSC